MKINIEQYPVYIPPVNDATKRWGVYAIPRMWREKNGELVGYTLLNATDEPDVIHISEMFTTIFVRGTGVGRKMLKFLEEEMKGSQFTTIDLMSAFMEADRIWERMGFKSLNFSDQYRKVVN